MAHLSWSQHVMLFPCLILSLMRATLALPQPAVNAVLSNDSNAVLSRQPFRLPDGQQFKPMVISPDTPEASASSSADSTSTATAASSATASPSVAPNATTAVDAGWKSVVYFPNWDIYGRNYQPDNLPVDILTHVIYAFANVRDTGEVYLSDSYADIDKHYPGDSWDATGNNTYGCIKQLYLLKQKNRGLKTLFSIGGWTYSANFAKPASTEEGRTTFAKTSVSYLKDMAFDGIDIDWEYPKNDAEANDFVSLLQAVRAELDAYSNTLPDKPHFLLTIAAPAGPDNYSKLKIPEMAKVLDLVNLMAYDFAGSFSNVSGHQANIYPSKDNPDSTPFSTDAAVQYYIKAGLDPAKLILGMPLYGRAFEKTEGPGKAYSGVGSGSWENGIWDYKALPKDGAKVEYDEKLIAAWSYDNTTQTMISYDTPESVKAKTKYIQDTKLGGAMWWESNGDASGDKGLMYQVAKALGGKLDLSQNVLAYPDSTYTNIKSGMSNNTSSASPSSASASSTSSASAASSAASSSATASSTGASSASTSTAA